MTEENSFKLIKVFLSQCGIEFENFQDLDGMIIPREILLSENTYLKIKPMILELKKIFSSSFHTSMQMIAFKKQRWPLINLVRQVLRSCEYSLAPKRICDGYGKDGQKKFRRIFIINKLNKKIISIDDEDNEVNEENNKDNDDDE
jgi:hypothetical protein